MKPPSIFFPLLLQLNLAFAIPAPAPAPAPNIHPTAAPTCDATCLLRLIRYREQVNIDWLMALPFCSSLLQHEGYMHVPLYNYAAADTQLASKSLQKTITVTEIVTQTSTRFTFGDSSKVPVAEEGDPETDLGVPEEEETNPKEEEGQEMARILPRHVHVHVPVHLAPMYPDDRRSHEDICAAYWARYKPRPKPWEFHPEYLVRAACARIVYGDGSSVVSYEASNMNESGNDGISQFADEEDTNTGPAWAAARVGFAQAAEEIQEVATVTVQHTVLTDVVVELDTTTTKVSTWTRTRTETVTVFADEGFASVPTGAGVGVFNVA